MRRHTTSIESLEQRTLLAITVAHDLNDARISIYPDNGVTAGDNLFYTIWNDNQYQIWRTDGTAAGTRKLRPFAPDRAGDWRKQYDIFPLAGDDAVFLQPSRNLQTDVLWRSDGTREGTVRYATLPGEATNPFAHDGRLYFMIGDNALWTTDGTPKGTRKLADTPGPITNYIPYKGRLVFTVSPTFPDNHHFWTTDGTPSGTKPTGLVLAHHVTNPRVHAGRILYTNPSNSVLYATDTKQVTRLATVDEPVERAGGTSAFRWLERAGKDLLFIGRDDARGPALWRTDGTPEGTGFLEDVAGDSAWISILQGSHRVGNVTFFAASTGSGTDARLFRSDGTEAGTFELTADLTDIENLKRRGRRIFFFAKDEQTDQRKYYRSDGTPEGTVPVPVPGMDMPGVDLVGFVNGKYIVNDGPGTLSATDGSDAETTPIFRTRQTYSSNPSQLVKGHDGALYITTRDAYFSGNEFLDEYTTGYRLWRKDGNKPPVKLLESPGAIQRLQPAADVTFFTVWITNDDPRTSHDNPEGRSELWRTDGTVKGTYKLNPDNKPLTFGLGPPFPSARLVGDTLIFYAGRKLLYNDGEETIGELWKSDGTRAGTVKFADAKVESMHATRDAAYFADDDGALWTTDGAAAGTRRLFQLPSSDYEFHTFTPVGKKLFFTLIKDTPGNDAPDPLDLYVTNGTTDGTRKLRRLLIDPPNGSGLRPGQYTDADGTLYFTAKRASQGLELWKSDGTRDGTVLVRDVRKGPESSNPSNPVFHEGLVYFFADDGKSGPELWRTDGSKKGTHIVRNFTVDDDYTSAWRLNVTPAAGGLVFAAADGANRELWFGDETDGFRSLGTFRTLYSDPTGYVHYNGKLYFAARHPVYHTELWKADL